MARRVVEQLFTGVTTPYTSYDSTKTVLGDLIEQYSGATLPEKYAGPTRVGRDPVGTIYGLARPYESAAAVPGNLPHSLRWINKSGYYSTGTVTVSLVNSICTVTGSGTAWMTTSPGVSINATIGFGTTNPALVTTWYNIATISSDTVMTLGSIAPNVSGSQYVINLSMQTDWLFLADVSSAGTTRKIQMLEYNRLTSAFTWKGFLTMNFPYSGGTQGNYTLRGMKIVYQKYTAGTVQSGTMTPNASYWITGTVAVAGGAAAVVGTGTAFPNTVGGMMIGFGSTNPDEIATWYNILSWTDATHITLTTNVPAAGIVAGCPYVITNTYCVGTASVAANGTTVTGVGTTFSNTTIYNVTGMIIGFGSTNPGNITNWYVIQSRDSATQLTLATSAGQIAAGPYIIVVTPGTAGASGVTVTGTNTSFQTPLQNLLIGFGSTNPSAISTWYSILTVGSTTGITLQSGPSVAISATSYVIVMGTINGSGTTWSDDRIAIGSRIGFGSQDPTQISTWYYINSINSNTSMNIQTGATASGIGGIMASVTVTQNTQYVIEDFKILLATTNSTVTNGGLFMTMGLSKDDFVQGGTTISAAATVDKIKANYWLADAHPIVNQTACGCALDDFVNWQTQYCWVINGGGSTSATVYRYNFRNALAFPVATTSTNGKDTTSGALYSGTYTTTGNLTQNNNGRIATLAHVTPQTKSLYFTTVSRVYRARMVDISAGNNSWTYDSMTETPTGGVATYPISTSLGMVEIDTQMDRLIITTSGNNAEPKSNRAYVTVYDPNPNPFTHVMMVDSRQADQGSLDGYASPHPNIHGTFIAVWSDTGLTYIVKTGTAATDSHVYAVPLGADWVYAGGTVNQRLVTPALTTTNAVKLVRVYVNAQPYAGGPDVSSPGNLTIPTEPYRLMYRTSGISDNSGSWIYLTNYTGDLSGATPGTQIQFAIEFRTIGTFCIPNKIYSLACVYEDNTTDSHFQPSVGQSSTSLKKFAWRLSAAFGSNIPTLYVRLYDAVSGSLISAAPGYDTSAASPTAWEKSTDGGNSWHQLSTDLNDLNTSDATQNAGTYIRYTPAVLADNQKVRALLTLS